VEERAAKLLFAADAACTGQAEVALQFVVGFYQSDFTYVDRPVAVALRYVSSPSLLWCGRD
jgi:hypothetical protein